VQGRVVISAIAFSVIDRVYNAVSTRIKGSGRGNGERDGKWVAFHEKSAPGSVRTPFVRDGIGAARLRRKGKGVPAHHGLAFRTA
jgi:hypothetical protein